MTKALDKLSDGYEPGDVRGVNIYSELVPLIDASTIVHSFYENSPILFYNWVEDEATVGFGQAHYETKITIFVFGLCFIEVSCLSDVFYSNLLARLGSTETERECHK